MRILSLLAALATFLPAQQTVGNTNLMLEGASLSVIAWNSQPAIVIMNQGGSVCSFALPTGLVAVRLHVQAAMVLDSRPCTWGGKLDLSYSDTHTPLVGLTMPSGGVLFRSQPWGYPMDYRTTQPMRTTWHWSYCGATGCENSCSPRAGPPQWNALVCFVTLG